MGRTLSVFLQLLSSNIPKGPSGLPAVLCLMYQEVLRKILRCRGGQYAWTDLVSGPLAFIWQRLDAHLPSPLCVRVCMSMVIVLNQGVTAG
jgi:hypothetical protein